MEFNIPFNRPCFKGLFRPGPTQVRYGWIAWALGDLGKSIIFLAQAVETRQLKEIISGVYIHCFALFFHLWNSTFPLIGLVLRDSSGLGQHK